MDTENEKKPTPTPEYGSFTGLFKSPYRYPYEWAPFIMMIVQTFVAGGSLYVLYVIVGINEWISVGLGIIVGIAVGFLYNVVAPKIGWQKLHWIDVILSSDIFWP